LHKRRPDESNFHPLVRGLLFRLAGSRRSPYIEPLGSPYHVVGFTPRSLRVLAERAGFEVRQLWVRHGHEEWRKEKGWTASRLKSLALTPAYLAGEVLGRGTMMGVLLVNGYLPAASDCSNRPRTAWRIVTKSTRGISMGKAWSGPWAGIGPL
jgi:hypothetical protein